jgi:PAS domain S-box-containing protein
VVMSPLGPEQIAGLGFEQVVRQAPVAIAVIDASGRVIHSNERARALTDRQLSAKMPADLDGAIDIFHPDGRRYERHEWPAVRSLASGEEIVDEEFFYSLPQDARLWIRCSSSPVRGQDDEIVAAVLALTDVTERKRQEARLTYLAGLLDNTEDGIVAMDERYVLTVWNTGAEQLYGWRAEEVLGRHANEVARTSLSERERTEMRRQLAASGRWRGETSVARKDGTTVEAELVSVALRGERGEITGYLTIHRDISERRRADAELRAAQRRSETILESITDAFVAVDPDWRYTYVNDRALGRMRDRKGTALAREDILGRSMWEMFPEAVGTELQRRYEEAMRERRAVAFETFFEYTGEWIEAHAYPSGSGLSIYYRDVSARRRAEASLRDAQRRNEAVLESVTDAFYALDDGWCLTYANAQAVRIASELAQRALTRDEVLGQTLWALLPGAVGTSLDEHYRRAVRDRRPVVFEYRYPGSDPWFEVHAYPADHGLAVYFHEITERKLAERDRARRAEQQAAVADLGLRALADDDTQKLMHDAAAVVAAMLDVELAGIADRLPSGDLLLRAGVGWAEGTIGVAVGAAGTESLVGYTLLAGEPVVSEDINADARFTPSRMLSQHGAVSAVSVVIQGRNKHFGALGAFSTGRRRFSPEDVGFVQNVAYVAAVALERVDAEERLRDVREAERRRLARALHDEALQDLGLALAHAGRIAKDPSTTGTAGDIVPALVRVGDQLRAAIYDLRLGGEEHRPFRELLSELVAAHRERVSYDIELEVTAGTPAGSLGATGIEVARILGEALGNARRHAAPTRVTVTAGGSDAVLWCEVADDGRGFSGAAPPPGHGAGLPGMKERAALISGQLTIDSTPGAGTTVRIEVPLRGRAELAGGPVRVLLVEDHTAFRQALAGVFEQAGFRVLGQAGSLAQAREMLRDVDVAVLDLTLPDGFGADLVDELHAASPEAQALALSASLDRTEIARAVDRGAAAVLPKSTPVDEIVRGVRRLHAGETLLPLDEVVALLRFARREQDRQHTDRAALAQLTAREREVLQLLAEGLGSEQIAARLYISPRTQRNHVANILSKLGVHSQLQAVIFALRYDMVQVR